MSAWDKDQFANFVQGVLSGFDSSTAYTIVPGAKSIDHFQGEPMQKLLKSYPAVKVAKETIPNRAGFILQEGGVDYNFCFDELIEEVKKEYSAKLAVIAFKEEQQRRGIMQEIDYKGVNTVLRTYELQLLAEADYDRMLKAHSLKDALDVLKGTGYAFDEKEILANKNFEGFLMEHLAEIYHEFFTATPAEEVVELFALRYTYHNLKVLLKQRFSGEELEHLLIPIGKYSLASLKKLVETGEGSEEHPVLVEGVQHALHDFEEEQRIEAATIYMDTYYFKHLRSISDEIQHPSITKMVDGMIDLYNLSTLVRSLKQNKPRAFLHTVPCTLR
eukprot:TRINITY_DN58053_c0_g1_i1.p1 TRINITY_DN58053_c0_g1~~TRINITY_DN58053_c0_g1_i1.p1  ORF type:complete len:331 (+),score=55.48 TRINITY_DN58053_c0_g1_i1:1051-2043(+)